MKSSKRLKSVHLWLMKIKMKPQIKIMNHEQTQFLYERLRIVKKLVLSSFNLAFINYLILIVLIAIFGTKGEERKVVRYGFVSFNYQKKSYRLNVYKGSSKSGDEYFSIWFTDKQLMRN